jgi:hypothetical protein
MNETKNTTTKRERDIERKNETNKERKKETS